MADAHHDLEGARRRFGVYLISGLAMLWLVLALGLVAIIGLEALTMDDRCSVPGLGTTAGETEWQAWPPGEVCTFGDARVEEPGAWRGVAIVVELVLGVALFVVWRRSLRTPDPDWTA